VAVEVEEGVEGFAGVLDEEFEGVAGGLAQGVGEMVEAVEVLA
jgi:hypothetical protein